MVLGWKEGPLRLLALGVGAPDFMKWLVTNADCMVPFPPSKDEDENSEDADDEDDEMFGYQVIPGRRKTRVVIEDITDKETSTAKHQPNGSAAMGKKAKVCNAS